ncbi:MAG: NAD(P)H-dependent oxidoreductase [Thermodesulfobacteriota bacterium]
MTNVLHILASPRRESYSSRLAEAFLESYRQTRPAARIETLDLRQADIPSFQAPAARAKYAVLAGQEPRDEAEAAWQGVIEVIDHFKRFDLYVLSCPMWNFGIPYRLKQYIDVIVQPGLTFSYSADKGYSGLVTGRPLMLLLARGGVYPPGNPVQTYDYQETYLRTIFGFIGFTDIRSVAMQGTLQNPPEQIDADMRSCLDMARIAATGLAE